MQASIITTGNSSTALDNMSLDSILCYQGNLLWVVSFDLLVLYSVHIKLKMKLNNFHTENATQFFQTYLSNLLGQSSLL